MVCQFEKDDVSQEAHCGIANRHYASNTTARKICNSGLWWPTTLKDAVTIVDNVICVSVLANPMKKIECHIN